MSRMLGRYGLPGVALTLSVALAPAVPPPPAARTSPPPAPAPVPPPEVKPVDVYGDPLPPGALARMGSVRFRHSAAADILAMPDGKTLITAGRELRFWDVATGRLVRSIPVGQPRGGEFAACMALSGDGRLLATGHADGRVRMWDVESGKELWTAQTQPQDGGIRRVYYVNNLRSIALSANGKVLLSTVDGDSALRVWDATVGREVRQLRPPGGLFLASFAMSEDGRVAAAILNDAEQRRDSVTRVVLWDVASGAQLRPDAKLEGQLRAVALSRDGTKLAVADDGGVSVRTVEDCGEVWRAKTVFDGEASKWSARRVLFAPDGRSLVGVGPGAKGGVCAAWDLADGNRKAQWVTDEVLGAACVLPDSTTLAALAGGAIRLWDATTGRALVEKNDHPANVGALVVSFDGKTAVSCGKGEKSLRIWDVATGREARRCLGLVSGSDEVGISHDGRYVAASENGGTIRVWDAATGELLRTMEAGTVPTLLRFTPDGLGTAPYSGSDSAGIKRWNCDDGTVIHEPRALAPFGFAGLLASADGRTFGVEMRRATPGNPVNPVEHFAFRTWDGEDGRVLRTFRGHTQATLTAVATADGRTLATRSADNTIRLWETATGGERHRIDHPNYYMTCTQNLAISPDGRTVAAPDQMGTTVVVWDAVSGRRLADFVGHTEPLIAMEFTPDGRRLVSGAHDGTLLVWDIEAERREVAREPRRFADAALARYWDDIQSADAPRAYRAIWDLQDSPAQAVALFRDRLRPENPPDPARVAQWIRELDSAKYAVRERAERELREVVRHAETALRAELVKTSSAEVRARVNRLIDAANNMASSPRQMREQRAVEVLEALRTPEARQLLAALARDHGDNFLGRQAALALKRLALLPS